MTVARLFYTDPAKFGRSCGDCRKWVYDADTGRRTPDRTKRLPPAPGGDPRGEQDPNAFILRTPSQDPPCHQCAKTVGMDPRERHWRFGPPDPPAWCYQAFRHWQRAVAVNWQTPHARDAVVRRNADLFGGVREANERGRNMGLLQALGLLKRGG